MDRKKTILIAVLINAGLLVLLFVVAIHHDEPAPKNTIVQATPIENQNQPLFNDIPQVTAPLAQTPGDSIQPQGSMNPLPEVAAGTGPSNLNTISPSTTLEASSEVVHQLPPLALQESTSPIVPLTVPVAPESAAVSENQEVKVKRGDSLEKIAKAHHTSVDEIIRLNHLPSTFLRIGQVLKIPSTHVTSNGKSKSLVADHQIERHPEYYTVRVGDNPWTIAMKHHMKVDELLKVNNINEDKARRLKPGDRLRIR